MISLSSRENRANDPILRTYHIPENEYLCYDASGFFSPISIKDQLIRVCKILEHAQAHGIISVKRPLLIIGGSIAGSVAALKAAEMGIKTVLIDKTKLLTNIVTTSLRVVCPIQYDWTASHWNQGTFSIPSSKSSRSIFNLKTGALKSKIQELEADLFKNNALVSISSHTKMKSLEIVKRDKPVLKVKYKCQKGIKPPRITRFGMALSCTGFGKEKVFLENRNFRGQEFWKIADHRDIIDENNTRQKILICGSGDGALQDYLLMVTNSKTVKEIYLSLKLTPEQTLALEDTITRAEEKIKRKELWLNKSSREELCRIMKDLQAVHLSEVNKLLADSDVVSGLRGLLRTETKDPSKLIAGRIKLFFECDHFSTCYPLNRFIALLISEYLKTELGVETMVKNKSIYSITGIDHICDDKKPFLCAGKKHRVSSRTKTTCSVKGGKPYSGRIFDTVIIRFGLDSKSLVKVFGRRPAFPGTQILPYLLT